jgi:DNA-binding winged helix-turn-helix (wHTH) protein
MDAPSDVLRFADVVLDEARHEVYRGGTRLELTATEFNLLRYFLLNPRRVLSKRQILDHVWRTEVGTSNVVETYVSYLRRKLDAAGPPMIKTVGRYAAVDDGDVAASRADDLKAEAADNLSVAYSISETKTTAAKLGVTTAALNAGFKAARKALAMSRIDAAVADGSLNSTEAADLKAKLTDANLSGYKGGGLGGVGFGGGFGGRHGGFRH